VEKDGGRINLKSGGMADGPEIGRYGAGKLADGVGLDFGAVNEDDRIVGCSLPHDLMKNAIWIAGALQLLAFVFNLFRPEIRIDESSHPILPSTATEICSYYRAFSPYRALECDIPERDFEELSESSSWKLEEISEPIEIRRFLEAMRVSGIEVPAKYESEPSVAKIVEGRYFQSEAEPDGGNTLVAYDRKSGRAFFYFGGR
jgi:hypothetical protein